MTACCEPGCSAEVLCPVHQALSDLRTKVEADRDDLTFKITTFWHDPEQVDQWASERVALNRVLALMKEEQ